MFLVQLCAVKVRRTTAFERDVKQARRLDLPVLLLDRLKSQICNGRRRRSVLHPPIVISRKLSKIDRWLLWNTTKLASLILFSHSDPKTPSWSGVSKHYIGPVGWPAGSFVGHFKKCPPRGSVRVRTCLVADVVFTHVPLGEIFWF